MTNEESISISMETQAFAGLAARSMAFFIDLLLYLLIAFLVSVPLSSIMLMDQQIPTFRPDRTIGVRDALLMLVIAVTDAYYLSSPKQGTPGKSMRRLRVVGRNGEPVTFLRGFCRGVIKVIPPFAAVSLVTIFCTSEKTALHDILCSTRVIYGKK